MNCTIPANWPFKLHQWKNVYLFRATNSENGEVNKLKNQLTGEYGAVPATARDYKVCIGYHRFQLSSTYLIVQ